MTEPIDPAPFPDPPSQERLPPDFAEDGPPPGDGLPAVLPVRKKGVPWLAWPVIIFLVAAVFLGRATHQQQEVLDPKVPERELDDVLLKLQVRYVVGAADVIREMGTIPAEQNGKQMLEALAPLENGSVKQRLEYAIIAGELLGPQEGLKHLDAVKQQLAAGKGDLKAAPDQLALLEVLRRLYADYARLQFSAPSVSPQDRTVLVDRLGWFGELALAPHGTDVPVRHLLPVVGAAGAAALSDAWTPNVSRRREVMAEARETFYALFLGATAFVMMAMLGFVGLVLFLILAMTRKLRGGLRCGLPYGGVYAETFALWMLTFLGLSLGVHEFFPETELLGAAAAMFLSLLALAWPVLRGIPWAQVRQDVGWTAGRQPALEPVIGVGCYVMGLPLLLGGVLLMLVMAAVQQALEQAAGGGAGDQLGPMGRATHPIVGYLVHAGWVERLEILLLASVAAPIVEETMFRGVLYRHLREASCRTNYVFSVLFSATVVNFIFAAIHPQGLLGIPPLMALAYGFTMAREWRGTLIPSMVGHGLSNGLVMLLCMFLLGG